MSDKPEHVTAEYKTQDGVVVWREDPYPFRSKFKVGQTVYQSTAHSVMGIPYTVVKHSFEGVFGHGHITYVVAPQRRERTRNTK